MPQFLISALGSYGDVHPMVGLGSSLVARGHRVKLITNPYFEDVVLSAGVELLPLGTKQDYIEMTQHPDLWHPLRGPKLVLKRAAGDFARPIYELAVAHYVPGDTVLCAHALDLGSRVAAEKLAAPIASVDFAPGMLWSVYDSPRLRGAFGPGVPKWLKRMQFWIADKVFVRSLLGPQLDGLRRELGLAPVNRVFGRWMHNTDLTLGMFPDWFGPPQPDWPPNTRTVGFPLWDAPGTAPILSQVAPHSNASEGKMEIALVASGFSGDLCGFLAAGEAPIAFSPGSANRDARQFFEAAVDACRQLGRRGILLTKYDEQLPSNLPTSVRHFGFVPLSRLLPLMAALVHHGGIGTCAQGLAAGVPHVVRPMAFDQFDNSRRLVRLGVAEEIPVRRFVGRTVAAALNRLFESSTIAANCRKYAERCNGPSARTAACEALEQLASAASDRHCIAMRARDCKLLGDSGKW
jgi:UDP:flavonoid glycosyltransferase YjiC (YdhE family)